jgi:hypothetical protein
VIPASHGPEQLGPGCQHRIARIRQPRQERTTRKGHNSVRELPAQDSQNETARTGQPERDSLNRASRTGQTEKEVSTGVQDRTARIGKSEQDSRNGIDGTGQPKQDSQKRNTQKRTARTTRTSLPLGFELWTRDSSVVQQRDEKANLRFFPSCSALSLFSRFRILFWLRARERESAKKHQRSTMRESKLEQIG